MPGANILYVEREKERGEERVRRNMRNTPAQVFSVEKEKRSREALLKNEHRLKALAAAEKERRAQAAQNKTTGSPRSSTPQDDIGSRPPSSRPPETAQQPPAPAQQPLSAAQQQPSLSQRPPSTAQEPPTSTADDKLCQVVRVRSNGTVDLRLSSGEVVQGFDPAKLKRCALLLTTYTGKRSR